MATHNVYIVYLRCCPRYSAQVTRMLKERKKTSEAFIIDKQGTFCLHGCPEPFYKERIISASLCVTKVIVIL